MKRTCLGLALLTLAAVVGCGSRAESLLEKQIAGMNKTADAIEAGASEAEIKKLTDELAKTGEALDALKLSDAEKKALIEKYKDQVEKASRRLTEAMMKKATGAMGDMMKNMPQMQMPQIPMPQMPTP
ncbi:MAG: hypothetical protein JW809_00510 [Pirellulales bacterium]|nr:hypothetical protein [Pirellulales bacterium]